MSFCPCIPDVWSVVSSYQAGVVVVAEEVVVVPEEVVVVPEEVVGLLPCPEHPLVVDRLEQVGL